MWHCKICDKSFDESELANATLVTTKDGVSTYRFSDGVVHAFRKPMSEKWRHSMHLRWHVGRISVSDCSYCNEARDPIMGIGVTDLRQQTEQLPVEPDPSETFLLEENPLGIKPESPATTPAEPESNTTMAQAFKNIKRSQ